jgi:hypothetical protein
VIPIIEYSIVIVLGLALWVFSKFMPHVIAPMGDFVSRLMHHRNTRLALIAIWWWLGWHFFTE